MHRDRLVNVLDQYTQELTHAQITYALAMNYRLALETLGHNVPREAVDNIKYTYGRVCRLEGKIDVLECIMRG